MNIQIENNIQNNVPWALLPMHIRKVLDNNAKNYDRKIVTFSLKNQLRYKGNIVRRVLHDEQRYYERVVITSRERLMLYPYHLADMIVKGLRITPFNYYISVIERLMQAEKSYDTLPNFTAADCLRLLGIGRNEYIDLMNQSRTKRSRLFGRKNVRELLPRVPCDIHIEPWWRVEVGMVLQNDVKMVTDEELETIDKLIDQGSQSAGDLHYQVVLSLYKKGLIYLDVPVTAVDRVQVPPLQGFVMNRVMGDYFETLLYKIFVSIDEHTTVEELAGVLQVSIGSVKQAVSLYCRLRFARKLEPETEQSRLKRHASWNKLPPPDVRNIDITPLTLDLKNGPEATLRESEIGCLDSPIASGTLPRSGSKRIAFLYDSTLTAFLMMGNLSPGLKKHAVTMFEVGKLCEESMDSFLHELEKVSVLDADGEGEARRYFEHAVLLRSTVLSLRRLQQQQLLHQQMQQQGDNNDDSGNCSGEGAAHTSAAPIGLDLVRLESLNSLEDAVCERLLQKKYKLLVSMAPLSKEVRAITSLSPPHLGPAVPEVNSLWFKMFMYHMTGYGPPSLLLKKGYELRQLPRMFLGFSRLLVTAWLHEPAVIPIANVLHINGALQYSPVLIQAYGVHAPAVSHVSPFPFLQTQSHPSKLQDHSPVKINCNEHPAITKLSQILDLEHNCGYITFVNIGVPDFGISSWDPHVRLGQPSKTTSITIKSPGSSTQQSTYRDTPSSVNSESSIFSLTAPSSHSVGYADAANSIQSPVESHFAVTPVSSSETSSPRNGYISLDCNALLAQELDQLAATEAPHTSGPQKVDDRMMMLSLSSSYSFDTLCTPMDETVSVFNRDGVSQVDTVPSVDTHEKAQLTRPHKEEVAKDKGQKWTILDCHFGIPLFDVDANTKICDNLIIGGLTEQESLDKLTESNTKLGKALLDFISQCQYYPGENTSIIKRGRLIPLPKHNLAFNNGKVCEWSEK